jgi:hypothetical protein
MREAWSVLRIKAMKTCYGEGHAGDRKDWPRAG